MAKSKKPIEPIEKEAPFDPEKVKGILIKLVSKLDENAATNKYTECGSICAGWRIRDILAKFPHSDWEILISAMTENELEMHELLQDRSWIQFPKLLTIISDILLANIREQILEGYNKIQETREAEKLNQKEAAIRTALIDQIALNPRQQELIKKIGYVGKEDLFK